MSWESPPLPGTVKSSELAIGRNVKDSRGLLCTMGLDKVLTLFYVYMIHHGSDFHYQGLNRL